MKISHEVPLCFLEDSLEWNDYQYVLPHLIDLYPQYKKHILDYRQTPNSFIICDNGLFEGVNHSIKDLIEKIELIKPDIFIVPDVWHDKNATLVNAKSWMKNYKPDLPEGVEIMAVLQGTKISELVLSYHLLNDLGYSHIALNHSSVAYYDKFPYMPLLKAQAEGRFELIKRLVDSKVLVNSHYHHLLGASDWREFSKYKSFDFLNSVDTSSPIINGALGIRFDYNIEYTKPKEKLEDIFEKDLSRQKEDIIFNINEFRKSIR